jgi:hypothetical protein
MENEYFKGTKGNGEQMIERKLGKLEKKDLRDVWKSESSDFTPWLATEENLQLLGEAINIQLQLEAKEKNVGPFYADILCKDISKNDWVIIENQLERTDHSHLGQLLTYAAGLNAKTVIWIASSFTEEHRAAIDWLNKIGGSTINFFGIEVELWQIGLSEMAPKFNVVSKPNDWTNKVSESAKIIDDDSLSEAKAAQLAFWTGFNAFAQGSKIIRPTKGLPQNWMNISIGRSGITLCAIASFYNKVQNSFDSHEIRAELVLESSNSKNHFLQLQKQQTDIESELGESLSWYNPENARVCRIFLRRTTNLDDKDNWQNNYVWLLTNLEKMHTIFQKRIKVLE